MRISIIYSLSAVAPYAKLLQYIQGSAVSSFLTINIFKLPLSDKVIKTKINFLIF